AAPAAAPASASAAEWPTEAPAAEPPPPPNAFAKAIAVASPAVVKLYGVGAGAEHGYGSGVLISRDGRVVTTSSLLLESQNIRAVASDGRLYRAEVQYRDSLRQLALLRLHADPEPDAGPPPTDEQATPRFTPLRLGSSKTLRPGDWVLALGNPFKVAEGEELVSAMRGVFSVRAPLDARHRVQDFPYRGEVLIVDAVTGNPGSSGGALVDLNGNWVGLIGKALWSNLTNTRLNYAIPVEEVAAFLNDATTGGPAEPVAATGPRPKGYHGIRLFPLAYRHGLPFVDGVDLGSPADRAGVRKEDLILSVNGVPIAGTRAFQRACDALAAGDDLALVVKRGEMLLTITMKLEKAPQ
ncbi:MAG: S1C family serine protease, partial [Phycisphaerae bacterium]